MVRSHPFPPLLHAILEAHIPLLITGYNLRLFCNPRNLDPLSFLYGCSGTSISYVGNPLFLLSTSAAYWSMHCILSKWNSDRYKTICSLSDLPVNLSAAQTLTAEPISECPFIISDCRKDSYLKEILRERSVKEKHQLWLMASCETISCLAGRQQKQQKSVERQVGRALWACRITHACRTSACKFTIESLWRSRAWLSDFTTFSSDIFLLPSEFFFNQTGKRIRGAEGWSCIALLWNWKWIRQASQKGQKIN